MIFVTIGHHPEGFNRLVRRLEEIAPEIGEEIVIQAGYTGYKPQHMTAFSFKPYQEMLWLMTEARVIVCHGGGVVIDALMLNKPVIIVPRQRKYDEAINNHQVELAVRLRDKGMAEYSSDMSNLKELMMKRYPPKPIARRDSRLINYLREKTRQLLAS